MGSGTAAASVQKPRPDSRESQPLPHRLKKKWVKNEVLKSIDERVYSYGMRHGGLAVLVKDSHLTSAKGPVSKQMGILEKMKREEEEGAKMLPVEDNLNKQLRTGFREYVDYALDEVERYNISNDAGGQVTAEFDWTCAGDAKDIPSLRRSHANNRVDGPEGRFVPGRQGAA